jgi:hypothetical protein
MSGQTDTANNYCRVTILTIVFELQPFNSKALVSIASPDDDQLDGRNM